jgi:hypothetical protein
VTLENDLTILLNISELNSWVSSQVAFCRVELVNSWLGLKRLFSPIIPYVPSFSAGFTLDKTYLKFKLPDENQSEQFSRGNSEVGDY